MQSGGWGWRWRGEGTRRGEHGSSLISTKAKLHRLRRTHGDRDQGPWRTEDARTQDRGGEGCEVWRKGRAAGITDGALEVGGRGGCSEAGRAALPGSGSAPYEGGAKPGPSYRWWLLSLQSPAQPPTSCVLSSNPTRSGDVGDFPGRGFFLPVNSEQMDSSAPSATWLSNT